MASKLVEVRLYVRVTVDDQNVVDRCVNNENGWRDSLYPLETEDQVYEHLAYNFAVNHARLSQLDGWADLPDSAASGRVEDTECEVVE